MHETFGPFETMIETRVDEDHTGPITIQHLHNKFKQFNAKYFQNKLPKVEIKFDNLPGDTAGMTSYQAIQQGTTKTVQPDSLIISINDMFRSPNVGYGHNGNIDTIMLHEMTHVLMSILGHIDEKHGPRFRLWLQRLAPASGYSYEDLMGKQQAAETIDIDRLLVLAGV